MVLDKQAPTQATDRAARERRLADLIVRLRASGFRITGQRRAVLEALVFSERHPSADELYQEVRSASPSMSRATVYKTLDMLRRSDEVLELEFRDGGPGNRYDGLRPYAHPHLICTSCGEIADAEDEAMSQRVRELATSSGYQLEGYRVDLYGRCPQCSSGHAAATT